MEGLCTDQGLAGGIVLMTTWLFYISVMLFICTIYVIQLNRHFGYNDWADSDKSFSTSFTSSSPKKGKSPKKDKKDEQKSIEMENKFEKKEIDQPKDLTKTENKAQKENKDVKITLNDLTTENDKGKSSDIVN